MYFKAVERAFALLLQHFPRVLSLNQATLAKKVKIIMCSCILHNICILENDNIDFFLVRARNVSFHQIIRFLFLKNINDINDMD